MSKTHRRKKKGDKKMAVLTAKCNKAFVVAPEKSKQFLAQKPNQDISRKRQETLTKVNIETKK